MAAASVPDAVADELRRAGGAGARRSSPRPGVVCVPVRSRPLERLDGQARGAPAVARSRSRSATRVGAGKPRPPADRRLAARNCAGRFSAKARGPSLASAEENTAAPTRASSAQQSSSCLPSESRIVLRIAWTASGPLAATRSASSWALASAWPSGTTWPIRPSSLASGARIVPPGQQQLGGDRVGDLAGEPDRGAAHRVERPAGLGHPELGRLAGDPDVGALEDLGAAGDGGALDRGDERLGQPEALEQRLDDRGVVGAGLEGVGRRLVGGRLEVHPGAEVAAGAGEDADPDLGVVVHPVPGVAHDREHLAGERVARLGPVHGDDELVPVLLDEAVGRGLRHSGERSQKRERVLVLPPWR